MSVGPSGPGAEEGTSSFELPENLQWLRDPETKVIGIVAAWIVGGVLSFGEAVIQAVLDAGAILADVPVIVAEGLGAAAGGVGSALMSVALDINAAIVGTAEGAGPFGIIVLVAGYAGVFVLVVGIARWVLDVVNVPLIDVSAIVRAATLPIRLVRGWL